MENLSQYNAEGTTLRMMLFRITDILVEIDRIYRKRGILFWIDFGTGQRQKLFFRHTT
jgi:hypothetical protein